LSEINKTDALSRQGAEVVDPRNPHVAKYNSFSGTGYRLGQSSNDSEGMFHYFIMRIFMTFINSCYNEVALYLCTCENSL
jgi:hypothetical protein